MGDERTARDLTGVMLDALEEAVCLVEPAPRDDGRSDYRYLAVNAAMTTMFGMADLVGRTIRESFPAESEAWYEDYDRVLATGEPVRAERWSEPQGMAIEMLVTRATAAAGPILVAAMKDVTARWTAEQALARSEERFRAFVVASAEVVYRMSPDWSQMRELDGRGFLADTREADGDWMTAYIHPADRETVRAAIDRAIAAKAMFELEHRVVRHDGSLGWTLSRAVPVLGKDGEITEWLGAASDVTERCEEAERRAFLLRLSDAMRPLADAAAVRATACRMLGAQLGADRAYYVALEADGSAGVVGDDYAAAPLPSLAGRYPRDAFHTTFERLEQGATWQVDDAAAAPLARGERAYFAAQGVAAWVDVPLIKAGRLAAVLCVVQARPRAWTVPEVTLIEQVAERLWDAAERARMEAALRATEARQRALVEGVPQLVWRAVDGGDWTWASPQWTALTGQSCADSRGHGWLEPVHPDDRAAAMERWHAARAKGRFEAEYRLHRAADGRYRWFQTRATPVRDQQGEIVEWLGTSTDVDDLRQLQERQQVLLGELQHRVRNILAVVRSVFSRSVATGGEVEEIGDHFRGRLDALARTQVVVTQSATGFVDLEELIRDELLSVGVSDGPRLSIDGPDTPLDAAMAEPIGLAIHELTVNALKYGALKVADGSLRITWQVNIDHSSERRLVITWREQGVPAISLEPSRFGFGRELIEEALPYRLRAETTLTFTGGGAYCTISVPLPGDAGPIGSRMEATA